MGFKASPPFGRMSAMKTVMSIAAAALVAMCSAADAGGSAPSREAPDAFSMRIDPDGDFIRDCRESTCGQPLGYAGSMIEYPDSMLQWFFVTNRAETARMLKAAGARLVKEWHALDRWQAALAYANAKDAVARAALRKRFGRQGFLGDPKVWFSLRRENGMKVLLCLEQYRVYTDPVSGAKTNDIEVVKNTICDYLRWIRDNGFADQVAGFELGNEPYWGKDPEVYGRRWSAIVPAMKKTWPDAKIGMPLAEYRPNDPDIAAVRARCEDMTWCKPAGEFKFSRLNQWSGRFIVAMKPVLGDITHVIYHFYGANAAYGCSASGFHRIDNFAKVYPEIKDKKVWITEWRERADENNRIHQRFSSALWKAHYMLAVLQRADIDGANNHCIASLAGGLYVSDGKAWQIQWDSSNRNYRDSTGVGRPHMELGPSGPLFRLYADALAAHPIILQAGANGEQGLSESALRRGRREWPGVWDSALFYDRGRKSAQWVAAANPERTSLVLLCVNTRSEPAPFRLDLKGYRPSGDAVIDEVVGTPGRIANMSIPGEPKTWRESRRFAKAGKDGALVCALAAGSYAVVAVPLGRGCAKGAEMTSDDAVASAVADAAAAMPPPAPQGFLSRDDSPARKTLIRLDVAGAMPDDGRAAAQAAAFAESGISALGLDDAEKDVARWVRNTAAYGPRPVCGNISEASGDFRYLAFCSAHCNHVALLMVNAGESSVGGEIVVDGFKANEAMAVREVRVGPDGRPVFDCREEKCGQSCAFIATPRSFMAITLPIKAIRRGQ